MKYTPELAKALTTPPFRDIGLTGYSETLGLPRDNLELCDQLGRLVIDIGSGYGQFAHDISKIAAVLDMPTKVININPQLTVLDHREVTLDVNGNIKSQTASIAALVEKLPLCSGVADSIVSSWAFPLCNDERDDPPEEYVAGYSEIVRVLKPGGMAYVGPTYWPHKNLAVLNKIPNISVRAIESGSDSSLSSIRIRKLPS